MTQPAARRPPRAYQTGTVTRALRAATWILVVAGVVLVIVRYPGMPATVPVHFDITGTPDRFGPKVSIIWESVLWVALHTGMFWLSNRPQLFNYPAPVTAHNAQRLYREGERLMVWVMAAMDVAFFGIALLVTTGAAAGTVFIVGGLVATLIACTAGVLRSLR